MERKKGKLTIWVLSWLIYWVGLSYIFGYASHRLVWELVTRGFELLMLVPLVALNVSRWVPHYLFKKRFTRYFTLVGAAMVVILFYNCAIWYWVMPELIPTDQVVSSFWILFKPYYVFLCMSDVLLAFTISVGYALLSESHHREQQISMRENELLKAELQNLKTQIQPHFFFNTLNNIYSLSLESSTKVPDSILKLSSMMDYLLHESKQDWQLVSKEIDFIKSYIELELLRMKQTSRIEFSIPDELPHKLIPTLSLLPIVENAFKHLNRTDPSCFIKIVVEADDEVLRCKILNSFDPASKSEKGGFGLYNLEKRLKLMYTSKPNLLTFQQGTTTFESILQLPFRSVS